MYILTSIWVLCNPKAGPNLLFTCFWAKKLKKGRKSKKFDATLWKNRFFKLASECWSRVLIPEKKVVVVVVAVVVHGRDGHGLANISLFSNAPFSSLFSFWHKKHWKSRFQTVFGVRSIQTLVQIYNRCGYENEFYLLIFLLLNTLWFKQLPTVPLRHWQS